MRTIAGTQSGPLALEVSSWSLGLADFSCGELNGDIVNLEGGSGEVVTLDHPGWSWRQRMTQKRLALDEGVMEEESELFFSGGKDDWQKFWETTLAIDQKEPEPAWREAILLLMRWKKDDMEFFMVLEQMLREWMKEVLE